MLNNAVLVVWLVLGAPGGRVSLEATKDAPARMLLHGQAMLTKPYGLSELHIHKPILNISRQAAVTMALTSEPLLEVAGPNSSTAEICFLDLGSPDCVVLLSCDGNGGIAINDGVSVVSSSSHYLQAPSASELDFRPLSTGSSALLVLDCGESGQHGTLAEDSPIIVLSSEGVVFSPPLPPPLSPSSPPPVQPGSPPPPPCNLAPWLCSIQRRFPDIYDDALASWLTCDKSPSPPPPSPPPSCPPPSPPPPSSSPLPPPHSQSPHGHSPAPWCGPYLGRTCSCYWSAGSKRPPHTPSASCCYITGDDNCQCGNCIGSCFHSGCDRRLSLVDDSSYTSDEARDSELQGLSDPFVVA